MNFFTFVKLHTEQFEKFVKHWQEMHLLDPENYPTELSGEGDWEEQFGFYQESITK